MTALWILAFTGGPALALLMACAGLVPGAATERLRAATTRHAWVAVVPAGALVVSGDGAVRSVDWLLLGTSVHVDALGRPLLGLTVALYGLALAFVPRSGTERAPALSGLLLVCFTANAGVFVAADLVTFYLCFTVMSFVGYALVVHDRSQPARRAARIYLVMTVLGEGAVLAALVLIAHAGALAVADAPAAVAGSSHRDLIIALLLIGFGVKAGTIPLHVWLPLAHPAAPTPASAVLSGAMVKAGLMGWLRFLPLGEDAGEPVWGTVFVALALLGGFVAVPAGLLQDNPKVILAYSTISQMGFLTVPVGVALAVPQAAEACVLAAVVYALHHGLAKGALFLGVQVWTTERIRRGLVTTGLAVAGLAIVGAPLTSGYVAKYGVKEAVGDATFPAPEGATIAEILPWVAVGSTLLLARFAVRLSRTERAAKDTPVLRDVLWLLAAVGGFVPVWIVAAAFDPPQSVPGLWSPSTWWDQGWPLLLGAALALAAASIARSSALARSRLAHPRGDLVPPGDIVVVEERAAHAVGRALARAAARGGAVTTRVGELARAIPSPLPLLAAAQARLGTWSASGVVLLAVLAAALTWGVASW